MARARVRHDRQHHMFQLVLDDGEVAGYADYLPVEEAMTVTHLVVEPRFNGRGFASRLARAALDEARRRNLVVHPYCWSVLDQVKHDPDYLALVPEDDRRRFGLTG